jgi:3'-phosphoadenosine 5'-phosphosulfate sulfotransferase (PAPS reductase)/FAD synthetase
MTHIVQFSGGKDSTALVLWARENLPEFTAVFCDTGWEHPLTYAYIQHINETVLGGKLVTVKSEKYPGGMRELVIKKQMVPNHRMRFCTEELKVLPFAAWMNDQCFDEATVYQGIRAGESPGRAKMARRVWEPLYEAWIERPLFAWAPKQVFEMHERHNVKPNPLYRLGAARVGCFPCIMTGHAELRRVSASLPELWERIAEIENSLQNRNWFPFDCIPARFHSGRRAAKDGRDVTFPTHEDVRRYVMAAEEQQIRLWERCPVSGCLSVYNLCE